MIASFLIGFVVGALVMLVFYRTMVALAKQAEADANAEVAALKKSAETEISKIDKSI